MKTKEIKRTGEPIIDNRPKIKIHLDYKTIITVRSMDAFEIWKEKYPDAKIIN